mmetsp:Transcript_10019/g.25006  ORF Transcript_10019/g.25006 Transcript_10019/m.25006 type:complete len:211 (-) Transcript_10019:645-1277(-)
MPPCLREAEGRRSSQALLGRQREAQRGGCTSCRSASCPPAMAAPSSRTTEPHCAVQSAPWQQPSIQNPPPEDNCGIRPTLRASRSYVRSQRCHVLKSLSLGFDCHSVSSPSTASSRPEMQSLEARRHCVKAPGSSSSEAIASRSVELSDSALAAAAAGAFVVAVAWLLPTLSRRPERCDTPNSATRRRTSSTVLRISSDVVSGSRSPLRS